MRTIFRRLPRRLFRTINENTRKNLMDNKKAAFRRLSNALDYYPATIPGKTFKRLSFQGWTRRRQDKPALA